MEQPQPEPSTEDMGEPQPGRSNYQTNYQIQKLVLKLSTTTIIAPPKIPAGAKPLNLAISVRKNKDNCCVKQQ